MVVQMKQTKTIATACLPVSSDGVDVAVEVRHTVDRLVIVGNAYISVRRLDAVGC